MQQKGTRLFKLSPSDLTYLFEGCKYCFSLKVKHGITQPSMPMPGIFSAIAGLQKNFYDGKRTEEFCSALPPGVVAYGEQWVESTPICFDGNCVSIYIKGRFDLVTKFDDGTYGIIDCKTAAPSETKSAMYSRQLHAYAYALENPAAGALALKPITKLALLYLKPTGLEQMSLSEQNFRCDLVFHEVKRNDDEFKGFIKDMVQVLESDTIIPQTCEQCDYCKSGHTCSTATKGCTCCLWCNYRFKMRAMDASVGAALKDLVIPQTPECPSCNGQMTKKNGKFGEFWSCQKFPNCKGTRDVILSKKGKAF
ncbi:MAG: PD-(D/E)XK nuclease family protein [Candidatus Omnitrophota bacterium]